MSPPDRRRAELLETLRRLAAEGGREAARALGQLLGRPTQVDEVQLLEGPDAAGVARMAGRPDVELVAIAMELHEPLGGRFVLLLSAEEAERISQRLVPDAAAGSLDAVGESALVEMGNIAGSAFVSALARHVQVRLLHGVPRLTRGRARACLDTLAPGLAGPALGVRFGCPETVGTLLLLPDPDRLDGLARILEIP
ncbi:MAG: CheC, inhibitor of methylation [Anaeromyxobacteraceae bacterium]|jgi:chemotaxis protein CheC|nr:CheC, inhibitor of methylation [Anaeromyxobacteraceae bacterium]